MAKLTKKELDTITKGLTSGAIYIDADVSSGPLLFSTKDERLEENSIVYETQASVEDTKDQAYKHMRLSYKTRENTKYKLPVFKYEHDGMTCWFVPTDRLDDIEFKIIFYIGTSAPSFAILTLGWIPSSGKTNKYSVSELFKYEPNEGDFDLMSRLFNLDRN